MPPKATKAKPQKNDRDAGESMAAPARATATRLNNKEAEELANLKLQNEAKGKHSLPERHYKQLTRMVIQRHVVPKRLR
jgi:hypothetical protein